jgi:hypothetical protein
MGRISMKVFISHIHEESGVAKVLKDWVESTFAGQIQVFVSSDIKDIPAGSRWLSEIDSALGSTTLFLMLCSPASLSRSWVSFEAGCAWIKKVPLIPLCHSGIRKSELPSPISTFQAIELESDKFIDDFLESIKIHSKIAKLPRIDRNAMLRELKQALNAIHSSIPPIKRLEREKNAPISDNDALNVIESWMGSRSHADNIRTITFSDVDSELNLPEGTAKRLIESAARRWDYITRRKGEDTILFEEAPRRPVRNRWDVLGF